MKLATNLRALPLVAFGAALLLTALPAGAAYTYHATINTASLPTLGSGTYSLDLSFVEGGSGLSNNVSVSNFTFGGGGTIVGSATPFGGVTGDLTGTVAFDKSSPLQDLFQGFSAGTTSISFDVTSSANGSITPDTFSVSLLDNTLTPITTTDSGASTLFTQPIDLALAGGTFSGSTVFSGTGAYSGISVAAVPEPSRAMLLVGAFGALIMRRRRVQA